MKLRRYLIAMTAMASLSGMAASGSTERTSDTKWTRFSHTQADGWYTTDDARGVADNVLLYQKLRRLAQEHTYAHGYERRRPRAGGRRERLEGGLQERVYGQ